MPSANPFAPVIEIGGGASIGPVSANATGGLNFGSAGENHVSAGVLFVALAVLVLLWKNRFRFSTTVG